jgi:hypothetical protein
VLYICLSRDIKEMRKQNRRYFKKTDFQAKATAGANQETGTH